jgi:DNA-binding SARP family transcriptional activator/tetratricopeptide (TPR) repeat protein
MPAHDSKEASVRPIEFRLFGGPEIRVQGEIVPLGNLSYAALAVMAAHGRRGAAIDLITRLLWDDGDGDAARSRLSQGVSSLRSTLGNTDIATCVKGRYLLGVDVVSTDLEEFHLHLADQRIEEAAELMAKGFLPNLRSGPTGRFFDWVKERETRLRGEVTSLLEEAFQTASDQADWEEAGRATSVLTKLHPESEQRLRDHVKVLTLLGSLDEGTRLYRRFAETTESSGEAGASAQEFLRSMESLAQDREARVFFRKVEGLTDPPLFGREEEVRQLRMLLASPPQGLRILSVTGGSGVGKTRFCHEVLSSCLAPATRVLSARCVIGAGEIPFSSIGKAFDQEWVKEQASGWSSPWRDELALLFPEFAVPRSPTERPLSTNRVSYEAIFRLLRRLAEARPLVLFFDDIQWADSETLAALAYLQANQEALPLSLLVTVQTGGDTENAFLASLLEVPGPPNSARIDLQDLSDVDLERLLEHYGTQFGGQEDGDGHEALVRLSHGNPGAIVSVMADLALADDFPHRFGLDNLIQSAVANLVLRRSSGLPSAERRTLQLCAVYGAPVSPAELQPLVKLGAETLSLAIEGLVARDLLCWKGRRVDFPHTLIRDLIYRTVPRTIQGLTHEMIAKDLLARDAGRYAPQAAEHLVAAGRLDEATPLVLRVAERARDEDVRPRVVEILDQVLRSEDSRKWDGGRLQTVLGELLVLEGRLGEAEEHLSDGLKLSQRAGDLDVEFRARFGAIRAAALRAQFASEEVSTEANALRRDMLRSGLHRYLPEVLELELRVRAQLGEHRGVQQLLKELPTLRQRLELDVASRIGSLASLGSVYGEPKDVEGIAEGVLAAAEAGGDHETALKALNWLVILGIQRGTLNTPGGVELRRRAHSVASASANTLERLKLLLNTTVWYLDAGDLEGAEAAARRANEAAGSSAPLEFRPHLLVNQGEVALERRDFTPALDHFRATREALPRTGLNPIAQYALAGECLALFGLGRQTEARELAEELGPLDAWYPFDISLLARAHSQRFIAKGKRSEAMALLRRAAELMADRFKMGWIRLGIEQLRLDDSGTPSAEEIRDFVTRQDLPLLQSRLRILLNRPRR